MSDRTGGSENGPRKNRAGRQATGILKTLRAGPWRPAPLLFDSAKTSPGNAQGIWRAISPRSARLRFGAAWFKPRRLSGGNPTHGNGNGEVGLHLRRRQGRGQGRRCSDLLGGKGANLAEMANLGLPVPPGFTITTEVCTYYYDHGQHLSRRSSKPRSTTALAHVGEHRRPKPSATPATRCSSRCAPARAPRCPA